MLSANLVITVALLYVFCLFVIAFIVDRQAKTDRWAWLQSPIVYTLSISVFCTSWTFYGAVGFAARSGLEFITIYLGPTIIFIGWWLILRKLIRIGRVHNITSIADLISSRYGKSNSLAAVATLIAVIGTTPYIALQLKALTTSLSVLTTADPSFESQSAAGPALDYGTGFWIAVGLAVFTILFGTRSIDANERNYGVVAAIAVEAVVKLAALLAVGLFVVFSISETPTSLLQDAATILPMSSENFGVRWVTLIILAAAAVICLPRQFHVTIVENSNEKHMETAAWLFPLYLFLMSLFILPIAIAGLTVMPAGSNPDMFVLTLPLSMGQDSLALLAFLGGFSSATSMVIVASIALSTMVSNHILMPLAINSPFVSLAASGDVRRFLLHSRRWTILVILLLGFLYFRLAGTSDALAAIGLIAFCAVAQFLPPIIAGIFWKEANRSGALVGLSAGALIWAFTLFLPSFKGSLIMPASVIKHGLFGIELLKPHALFGLQLSDTLVHALFWSWTFNILLLIIVSLLTKADALERLQATLFVDVFKTPAEDSSRIIRRSAAVEDLFVLAQQILGADEARELFEDFALKQDIKGRLPEPTEGFIDHLERQLAGSIGAASAHAMVSRIVDGQTVSLEELMTIADETARVIQYSQQLEDKSQELEETARQLRDANERLMQLDVQKDDFLSQVSHELRTPMTSIRSFVEILSDDAPVEEEKRKRFLSIIHGETERLTSLLDEILDLNFLERGDVQWKLDAISANAVLQSALATCQPQINARGVLINLDRMSDHIRIWAKKDRLAQVFINIITNAVKYNENPSPKISIRHYMKDGMLHIILSDNGPGIRDEDHERVFSKFARGWQQTSPEGAGLGLAISRQIMMRLNGTLTLLPYEEGKGARFKISLPLETHPEPVPS